jgi:hypothetical protein
MKISRKKPIAATFTLILTVSIIATIIALPSVYAQYNMEMNLPGNPPHYVTLATTNYDIDLNGAHPGGDMELWYTLPSDPNTWIMFGSYNIPPSADLDIYDFAFTETGEYKFKWMLDGQSSDIGVLTCFATSAEIPPSFTSTLIYVMQQPVAEVGKTMFISYWTLTMPPDIGETAGDIPSPSGRAGWYNISLEITKPDGTIEIVDMPYSDPVGGGYLLYTPTQTGTHSVVAVFGGTWKNSSFGNVYWEPMRSASAPFEVSTDPIGGWPEAPPPDSGVVRPVSGASHNYWSYMGNWLGSYAAKYPNAAYGGTTNNFGWGDAPESAHILWSKSFFPSGSLLDSRFGTEQYTLNHYQDVNFDGYNLIVDGVIHYTPQYTAHQGQGSAAGYWGWGGLSLYTGEKLFEYTDIDVHRPDFGQIFLYKSPNQHGGFSYLIRDGVDLPETVEKDPRFGANQTVTLSNERGKDTWEVIDAYTRNRVCWIGNVSDSGRMVNSKIGAITYYDTDREGDQYYLTIWNSTTALSMYAEDPPATGGWQWRPQWGGHSNYIYRWREHRDAFHDGNDCFALKVPIPSLRGPSTDRGQQTASIRVVREGDIVIFGTAGINDDRGIVPAWFMGVSLEEGREGQKLWETTFDPPRAETAGAQFTAGMVLEQVVPEGEGGVVIYENRRVLTYWAYDIRTGELLWTISEPEQGHYYSMYNTIYDGKMLAWGRIGGHLRAYDLRTGDTVWDYVAGPDGTETPYGNALVMDCKVADNKVYFGTSEHSATTPLWRTPGLRCVDATNGQELWKILWWGDDFGIADGILVGWNWFDGQVYGFGKGPSATTVTAPDTEVPLGTSVVIKGTVTDQTPTGERNIHDEMVFTLKDTPAISDEDMAEWMQYMFMEQGFPMDAKGVEVVLYANDNEIGRTTSDVSGTFSLTWEPPSEGDYTICAAFEGSRSYGSSSSTTGMTVGPALEMGDGNGGTTEPVDLTDLEESVADVEESVSGLTTYILVILVLVIIAIVIAVYTLLRSRQ